MALRVISGLSVKQIARAFLVGEAAMEQRITRAKSRVAAADIPFEAPGPIERAERLAAVAAMVYLVFNEGYSASSGTSLTRADLSEEAIRLGRLLLVGHPATALREVFAQVDPLQVVVHVERGQPVSMWGVTVCRGFRGFPPASPARPHY